jgi:Zn-dependent protease/predicted transcriptional regulator
MPGRSFRIARIAGIPVGISPWWLVIVALMTWTLGASYYPSVVHGIAPVTSYALGLGSALLLFASILAHEFGHALVARARGIEIEEIDLWLLGGVSRMSGQPQTPEDELKFALAGPAVTAVIALVFGALALALPKSAPALLRAVVDYEAEVNVLILVFNLLPAFPLDGGRVARALLWRRSGDMRRATATAAGLGRAFGYFLVAAGFLLTLSGYPTGLWFVVIGAFLIMASSAERAQEELLDSFAGTCAADLMSEPAISIPSGVSLQEAGQYFGRYRYTAFPVIDAQGRAIGLVGIDRLERTPAAARSRTVVDDVVEHDPRLIVRADEEVVHLLEQPAFQRIGRAVVVDDTGRPVGLLSITDIQRAIRATRLTDDGDGHGDVPRVRSTAPRARA